MRTHVSDVLVYLNKTIAEEILSFLFISETCSKFILCNGSGGKSNPILRLMSG